jgi:aminoglycoside 6-adenylyltransferase
MNVEQFLEQLGEWARGRADVRGAFVLGSQARTDVPADEFSDVDVVLVVAEPAPYTDSADWLEAFGRPLLTFLEPTPVGGLIERRVLFDSGLEVDFTLLPEPSLGAVLGDSDAMGILRRGYRIVYDEVGLERDLGGVNPSVDAPLDAARLAQLANDFWYHALWAAKKLRRGELYVAKQACDGYLKALLVELLATDARESGREPWQRGRFLERWAEPHDLAELGETYAVYDAPDIARAIKATASMFKRLEAEVSDRRGLEPFVDHDEVVRQLEALLDPVAEWE